MYGTLLIHSFRVRVGRVAVVVWVAKRAPQAGGGALVVPGHAGGGFRVGAVVLYAIIVSCIRAAGGGEAWWC